MNTDVIDLSERINESLAQREEVAQPTPFELEPGIHRDVEMRDYLRLPYMSASKLEKLRRSPMQLLHAMKNPERKATPALEKGTALHLAILEPHLFDGHYVTLGQCEGQTQKKERCSKSGSASRDGASYCGTHDPAKGQPCDVEVISQGDYDAVLGMRSAIMDHPRARTLFEGRGEFEVTIVFDDPITGVRCKIRPDRLIERAGMLVDIKTTFDAAPWSFARQAENLGYFRKLAFYRRGLWAVSWPYKASAVVAPESAAPYDLVCYLAEESDLDGADAEVTNLLRVFDRCVQDNEWNGYANEFQPLRRPAWATSQNEATDE